MLFNGPGGWCLSSGHVMSPERRWQRIGKHKKETAEPSVTLIGRRQCRNTYPESETQVNAQDLPALYAGERYRLFAWLTAVLRACEEVGPFDSNTPVLGVFAGGRKNGLAGFARRGAGQIDASLEAVTARAGELRAALVVGSGISSIRRCPARLDAGRRGTADDTVRVGVGSSCPSIETALQRGNYSSSSELRATSEPSRLQNKTANLRGSRAGTPFALPRVTA